MSGEREVRAYYPSGSQAVVPCSRWLGYRAAGADTGAVFVEVGPPPGGEVFGLDPRAWVTWEDTGETLYDPRDNADLPAFARDWLREHPDWLSPRPKRSLHPLSLEELRRRSG
jgi:hypothetical protein